MIELIDMVHARGNLTTSEAKLMRIRKQRRELATQHDRIGDGRAPLQRAILAYMRSHPDTWHTCASIAHAIDRGAAHVTYAANRMWAKGMLDCQLMTIHVLNNGGAYYMRPIKHFRLTETQK